MTPIVIYDSIMLIIKEQTKPGCFVFFNGEICNESGRIPRDCQKPIDVVEHILNRQAYELERRSRNEVVVEIKGRWNEMLLVFSWEESMHCLHVSCLINIEDQQKDHNKIFELLALINDDLWVGHFSYWTEQKMPVFRYSLFYNPDNKDFSIQLTHVMDIAVKECERMYPVFNVVLTKGMEPRQALYPMLLETLGQA